MRPSKPGGSIRAVARASPCGRAGPTESEKWIVWSSADVDVSDDILGFDIFDFRPFLI